MRNLQKTLSALLFATAFSMQLPASAGGPRKVNIDHERLALLPESDQERVLRIADRLEEITGMDRSDLDRAERRALRREVHALKQEADAYNRAAGGTVIYISSAGLILILILLIILL